ncbi:MAG: hypothetical protein KJO54_10035 [Gammaproteobacteria bacterium]|nr:hypothetical protein [Gammaproteobacteria bacterium]NNM21065.1 hypothetical protein [Gammaproteobacteria bacterium]
MKRSLAVLLLFIAVSAPAQQVASTGLVRMAPDGEYIAATVELEQFPGVRNLVTMQLADGSAQAVTGFADSHVSSFFWANDDRLVFSVEKSDDNGNGIYLGSYTILRDGSGGLKLQERLRRRAAGKLSTGSPPSLLHRLPTNWNSVLISRTEPTAVLPEVFQLDAATGRMRRVVGSQYSITEWIADNQGAVRAAVDRGADVLDGSNRLLYRDSADDEWRKLLDFSDERMQVLGFHADNRRLIVLARGELGGKALHYLNPTGELGERLLSDSDFDLANRDGAAGLVQTARGDIMYYQYFADTVRTIYFDSRWESRQQVIDEALSGSVNTIIDWSDDERQALVTAVAPDGSVDYYLFDTTFRELKFLQPPGAWIR